VNALATLSDLGIDDCAELRRLNDQQRMFVLHLLESPLFNAREAAKKAGYAQPKHASVRLMKKRDVKLVLASARKQREQRVEVSADDIVNYLHTALFFNPTHLFLACDEGSGWMIRDLKDIPEKYGRLIDGIESKTVHTREDEEVTYFKIKLISKAEVLKLAMKHAGLLETKVRVEGNITLNWADMQTDWDKIPRDENSKVPDALEQRILEVEAKNITEEEI